MVPASRSDGSASDIGDELPLEKVRRDRLYEQVVHQIQQWIVTGQLKPGDKLPPERELARRFRVSRGSVQSAIHALQLLGLVRSKQGGGTTICEACVDAVVTPLSLEGDAAKRVAELLELRKMLEPPVAAAAAERAMPEELARLEELLRRQEEKMRRGESVVEDDSDFHYTIAMATRNSVVRKMVDLLMDQLRESRARGLQVPGRADRSLEGHRRIVEAIRRGDSAAAGEAMLRHITEIERVILGASKP